MDIHAEITIAEGELYRAMIAQNASLLRELLADDLIYIHSNGVSESKQGYFDGLAAGLYDYEAIETLHAQNWSHGEVVVRSGAVRMLVGERGRSKSNTTLLITALWRREADAWRLVLRQATRVPNS